MNRYKRWFSRVVWIGIGVNTLFSVLAYIAPDQLLISLNLQTSEPDIWVRFSGNLLILLSIFYILAAVDPDRYRPAAWLAIFARFEGVAFFSVMVFLLGFQSGYLIFAAMDLLFAVPQLILLRLGTREERSQAAPGRRLIRRLALGLAVILLLSGVFLGWYHLFREVPQQLTSIEDYFKYGSIGVEQEEGLPYLLWLVLPRMFPEHLPGPGGYLSTGMTWEEGRETPVGLSKKTIGFDRVAINCAFCHTATVRTSPEAAPAIYPGGPAHQFDSISYVRFLFACASDRRFTADNIMDELENVYQLSWFERLLYRYAIIPTVRDALLEQKERFAWTEGVTPWGHGRIDPFNQVKLDLLELQPWDGSIGNSDMVPIWNLEPRQGQALHWDGLNTVLPEVTRSSAIGDGATPKTIPLEDLDRMEAWLKQLQPPAFPFPIDEGLAAQGANVYARECAQCHDFGQSRTGTVIPQPEVGTDPHRLQMWTQASADAYNDYAERYDWDFDGFRKTDGYVAVPLDGVWIRAPYLHNGSVPTLRDLLEPPENRPQAFYRGYDVYDPEAMGFISDVAQENGHPFTLHDTSLPANSNQGHLYGTSLTAEDKRALLEYLKTK